eukprot:6180864-Pleurochrysis_carterae.AAC.2
MYTSARAMQFQVAAQRPVFFEALAVVVCKGRADDISDAEQRAGPYDDGARRQRRPCSPGRGHAVMRPAPAAATFRIILSHDDGYRCRLLFVGTHHIVSACWQNDDRSFWRRPCSASPQGKAAHALQSHRLNAKARSCLRRLRVRRRP